MDCLEILLIMVISMWLKNNLKTLFILMPRHHEQVLKMEGGKI
jgi:hypothetical protein